MSYTSFSHIVVNNLTAGYHKTSEILEILDRKRSKNFHWL